MKITAINGRAFTPELAADLRKEYGRWLANKRADAAGNPNMYEAATQDITILLEPNDSTGIILPFRTNSESLRNVTDYTHPGKLEFFRGLMKGKLRCVGPVIESDVMDYAGWHNISEVKGKLILGQWKEADYNIRDSEPETLWRDTAKMNLTGTPLEQLAQGFERISRMSEDFKLDKNSSYRGEHRAAKNGSLYEVSVDLDHVIHRSDAPPLHKTYLGKISFRLE